MSTEFAVFDLETTGFSPAHHHRVVEIGVVVLDASGQILDEWETLINPERDVGATEIHGLTAGDVLAAPRFPQIAGELEDLLRDRVPVAHNIIFDARFLAAEYARIGCAIPLHPERGLCTMRLASRYLPTAPRNLAGCCRQIGYALGQAHSALDDARAAAGLLRHYMRMDTSFHRQWHGLYCSCQQCAWPPIALATPQKITRAQAQARRHEHFLAHLASRAPREHHPPSAEAYLAVLDRALIDRHISLHEQNELIAVANWIGLSQEEARHLHADYWKSLLALARSDGIVTAREREELERVAEALGLCPSMVQAQFADHHPPTSPSPGIALFRLKRGDTIVFTGEAPGMDRQTLSENACNHGLRVCGNVSRKTTLLIAADPDSLSGKARKARELSIPVVGYDTFSAMLKSLAP